jgi:tetratricopeptide (TPR) repeat protein
MSKISLRDYNHEIEGLTNSGKTDEAIAHCKYILRLFPKCVDTYRLLGKAYLEAQRYGEATDILTRILSVVPDDFVSQIGMSIIREDEGNLDAAIYHMERAFEVKPSNSAIQEELRRLYGRRDGITPPRVRLTRGALVRMYTRGELYPQAIAEIRASLAEDPKRVDLEVILARIYMILGRKAEAIEVCSRLVSKLPNCLEANRILAEILPGTSRGEDAEIYHQKVIALDPYSADITSSTPTSNDVPDNAIMVDFLEYQPGKQGAQQPEWASSIGVNFQDTEEAVPDWLVEKPGIPKKGLPEGTPAEAGQPEMSAPAQPIEQVHAAPVSQPAEAVPAQPSEEDALIPDWMKTAGWAETAKSPVEPQAAPTPAAEAGEEIAAAEIPDWLKAIAPTNEPETSPAASEQEDLAKLDQLLTSQPIEPVTPEAAAPVQAAPEAQPADAVAKPETFPAEVDMPSWLEEQPAAQAFSGETQPASKEEIPDWLAGLSIPPEAAEAPAQATPNEELPDWLKTFAAETPVNSALELVSEASPDWLKDFQEKTEPAQPEEMPVSEAPVQAQAEEPMPDWLRGLGEETTAPTEVAAAAPVESQAEGPVTPFMAEVTPQPETGLPEAQPEMAAEEQMPEAEITPQPEAAAPEPMLEMASVAAEAALSTEPTQAEVPAEEPAAKTQPMAVKKTEQPVEELPVQEVPVTAAQEPGMQPVAAEESAVEPAAVQEPVIEPVASQEPAAEPVPAGMATDESIDAALAWLESLAANQGAGEENMLIPPEQRTEAPPAWIQKEIDAAKAAAVETPPQAVEEEVPVAPEIEPIPLAEVETPVPAAEEVLEPKPAAEIPEPVEAVTPAVVAPVEEIPVQEPVAAETAAPAATSPEDMDLDAAFAWLESLAARQGAEPETLSVPAEERQEQPPAWVEKAAAETEAMPVIEPAAELPTAIEEPTPQEPALEPALSTESSAEAEPAVPEMPVDVVLPVQEPVEEEPLPDWLKGLETPSVEPLAAPPAASGESVSTWLQNVQVPEEATEGAIPEQPVSETPVEPLPEWLQGIETVAATPIEPQVPEKETPEEELPEWLQEVETPAAEPAGLPVDEGLPEWLRGIDTTPETVEPEIIPVEPIAEVSLPAVEVPQPQPEEVMPPVPVEAVPAYELPVEQPVELIPAEEALPVAEAAPEAAAVLKQPETIAEIPVTPVEEIAQPAETLVPEEKPAEELPAIPGVDHSQVFAEAQGNLDAGDIDQALPKYAKLIESKVYLEEIIRDLQNALYRSPVDVGLHETLGDAFAQSNRLQEALDTYTKAEELLVK